MGVCTWVRTANYWFVIHNILPISGIESDVAGIISATNNIKTVSESNTVIPAHRERNNKKQLRVLKKFSCTICKSPWTRKWMDDFIQDQNKHFCYDSK